MSATASATVPHRRPLTRREFNRALLAWHPRQGRTLQVREAGTPWAVLVAEVMSQQTQIGRVGPAWARFIERWPTPAELAAASTHDVLLAWAGLGYNRRALALAEAARAIVRDHDGTVPARVADLERLPGIGPYTARAIAAIAFGVPVAPLDVNVRRVIERVAGGAGRGDVQAVADALVSRRDARSWVNAVMDLAATTCTRRAPGCERCPIRPLCASAGTVGEHRASRQPEPFRATNRWLRGRLLAVVRDAPPGTWTELPERVGDHGPQAVGGALRALERDGFLELRAGRARVRVGPSRPRPRGSPAVRVRTGQQTSATDP